MTRYNMIKNATLILILLGSVLQVHPQQAGRVKKPDPDFANLKYGEHERNVLDLWLARSDKPTPLVLFIHGGGFRQGDKRSVNAAQLLSYLKTGFMSNRFPESS